MAPSLSTMPAEILDLIFENVDFVTIQIVRKVCRHLRNHIDHFPPDSKLEIVNVYIHKERPNHALMMFYTKNKRIEVNYYKNRKNGCRMLYGNREKHLQNQDFASVIGNDLGLILKNQISEITKIGFYFPTIFKVRLSFHGRFFAALVPYLESRRTLLATKEVHILETNQKSLIMKCLQYLNPSFLEYIKIMFDKQPGFSSPTMKIDNLIGLDQWKQAKSISIQGLSLASRIENFSHLEKMVIELKQISGDELIKLRETIIHRPSFINMFTIHYRHFIDPGPFTSVFGEPDSWESTVWFNVPNNNENALRIRWYPRQKWISFECSKRAFANGAVFN